MLGVITLIVTWCQKAGFRPNYQGLLPSLEVFKSNASSVIGRLTEVYSLRSSVFGSLHVLSRVWLLLALLRKFPCR